jgi:hypothetical protein
MVISTAMNEADTAALARQASLLEPFLHFNLLSCKLRVIIQNFLSKTKSP